MRLWLLLFLSLPVGAWALPEGAQVQSGQVQVQSGSSTLTVTQSSPKAIINWNGFSIGAGELVQFLQPGASSAILNRVVGQDPSVILGALRANGHVYLINPNGILFGPSALIDVGSLTASTLNISNADFLSDNLVFTQMADKPFASVVNQGTIRVQDDGFVVLAAPLVSNEKLIVARQGQVALAGGTQAVLNFDGAGLVNFEVAREAGNGDVVLLGPDAVSQVLRGAVNASHLSPATELVQRDGEWVLQGAQGVVVQSGTIDVSGPQAGSIALKSTDATVLTSAARMHADGQGLNSPGGVIDLLSDGSASAERGALATVRAGLSGDGGQVELSGPRVVTGLKVDAGASDGKVGTYLIDPAILTVAPGTGVASDTVYELDIEASGANVTLVADDQILVLDIPDDEIDLMPGLNLSLELLNPFGSLDFDDADDRFTVSGAGTVTVSLLTGSLNGGEFETGGGQVSISAEEINSASVFSGGGTVIISTNLDIDMDTVDAGSGFVDLQSSGGGISVGSVTGGTVNLLAPAGDLEADTFTTELNATADGNATLSNTSSTLLVDALAFGDLIFSQTGDLTVDLLVSAGNLNRTTVGGDLTLGMAPGAEIVGGTLELNVGGTVGVIGSPIPIDVGSTGSFDIASESGGVSGRLVGFMPGGGVVTPGTPGTVLFNGTPLPVGGGSGSGSSGGTSGGSSGGGTSGGGTSGGGGTGGGGGTSGGGPGGSGGGMFVPPTLGDGPVETRVGAELGFSAGQAGPPPPGSPQAQNGPGPDRGPGRGPGSPGRQQVIQLAQVFQPGGLTTTAILTLTIGDMGEIEVSLDKPSPFDAALNDPYLRADPLMDLGPGQLGEVAVTLDYDPSRDVILMNVNLSSDALLELGLSNLKELPVTLRYNLRDDARMMKPDLRLGDIVDLDVEELQELPVLLNLSDAPHQAEPLTFRAKLRRE